MFATKRTERLLWGGEVLLLVGTVAVAARMSDAHEWHPVALAALLLVLALGGEWFTVETSGGVLSASTGVMILAAGLLGPVPAGACGVAAAVLHSAVGRRPPAIWLNNLLTYGVAAFAGGLAVEALAGHISGAHSQPPAQSIAFGLVLMSALIVILVVNFVLFAIDSRIMQGQSPGRLVRELFLPLLPGELAVGVIAVMLVIFYRSVGLLALFAALPILLIFRQLAVALVRSEHRAEQLDARTRQLASFQWAVPTTFMEGLGLRDPSAMRHGAAVASYAKALAIEIGCDDHDQEVIQLAGLLHDIGKFTWSDRILYPETLTDEDWAVIRRHPEDGAMMVGRFDGFGPVADAILYHHERMDGGGYPARLIGSEIPLASRVVAICSTYDSMTTRETYGPPMSSEEAIAELRKLAGKQLDAELVDAFVRVLEREGPTFGRDADYKTELAFDSRISRMADPRRHETAERGS